MYDILLLFKIYKCTSRHILHNITHYKNTVLCMKKFNNFIILITKYLNYSIIFKIIIPMQSIQS